MNTRAPRALAALLVSLGAGSAFGKPRLEISIAQAKQIVEPSKNLNEKTKTTRLVPIKSAASGDIVQYTLTYANKGDEVARDAVIDDPIPKGTTFIANSASGDGAEISFSSDGGKTFAAPVKLTYEVRNAGGGLEKRIAIPSEYTHVRFVIKSVPAGMTGTVGFRVRVN